MVDNFELIKPLLNFDNPNEFYFLQVIQRKKDFEEGQKRLGRNNNNRLIKAYYIYNVEQLNAYKEEIIKLCNLFNARAGINLNRRNQKDVAIKCLEILAIALRKDDEFKGVSKIYNSACGKECSSDKLWIVDIDEKEISPLMLSFIEYECLPKNNIKFDKVGMIVDSDSKIIAKIPTKNGWHLITKRFDRKKFSEKYPEIEIHTNNPTNLYIP